MKNPTDDDAKARERADAAAAAEPTVEDYRLALRHMIRTAINAEAAKGGGLIETLEIGGITYDLQPSNCPRCDGDGIEPNPKSNHPRPRPGGGFDCYECGGEGKVFELEVEK